MLSLSLIVPVAVFVGCASKKPTLILDCILDKVIVKSSTGSIRLSSIIGTSMFTELVVLLKVTVPVKVV